MFSFTEFYFWLGRNQNGWFSNIPDDWTNWEEYYPDYSEGDCVAFDRDTMAWSNFECVSHLVGVCEKAPA